MLDINVLIKECKEEIASVKEQIDFLRAPFSSTMPVPRFLTTNVFQRELSANKRKLDTLRIYLDELNEVQSISKAGHRLELTSSETDYNTRKSKADNTEDVHDGYFCKASTIANWPGTPFYIAYITPLSNLLSLQMYMENDNW